MQVNLHEIDIESNDNCIRYGHGNELHMPKVTSKSHVTTFMKYKANRLKTAGPTIAHNNLDLPDNP